jgi:hypothetical protein
MLSRSSAFGLAWWAAIALLAAGSAGRAEMPSKVALATAEIVAALVGAPVFAADGTQLGKVAEIKVNEAGEPTSIRFDVPRHLGLGARTLEIRHSFVVLTGAVALALPADAVWVLPELIQRHDDDRMPGR